jgi:NIMA (never in mitosis gene a)-related kinase
LCSNIAKVSNEFNVEGDLAHYLRKRIERKDYLSEKLIMNWLLQILIALDYIHSNKIIHRGLELSNIFLTGKGNIKLGSFGHSKVLESTNAMASTSVGRLGYMSPEMF